MPLVAMSDILKDAQAGNYAVGLFNSVGLDSLRAIRDAAEEMKSPVIFGVAEVHTPYAPLDMIGPMLISAAEKSKVPVAVHLDHGLSFNAIVRAIKLGFSSVMFDGSSLSYEENLKQTKEIVRIASACGVSVEAELGHVGGGEGGEGVLADPELYTDPEKARQFAEESGIDALAVAIGTVHGEFKTTPKLDLERLDLIRRRVKQPLVLHGGSGLSDQDFRNCISRGIAKINIFTEMSYAGSSAAASLCAQKKKLHVFEVSEAARIAMQKAVMEKMSLFGSAGKA